jgi:hypothetical protein
MGLQFLLILVSTRANLTNELAVNYKLLINQQYRSKIITYDKYFSKKLFNRIKNQVGKKRKVICLGIHPSVLQFNDFSTLGFYNNLYPLKFKKNMKKVQINEIKRDKLIFNYFMYWGNRNYLMSSKIGKRFIIRKRTSQQIDNLKINFSELKRLNVNYLISTVKIRNFENRLVISYDNFKSPYKIFLYRI